MSATTPRGGAFGRTDSQQSEPYAEYPLAAGASGGGGVQVARVTAMSTPGAASMPPTPAERDAMTQQQPPTTAASREVPSTSPSSSLAPGPGFGVAAGEAEEFTAAGKPLGEVIIELRGVTKQYRMHGSDEIVSALKCINLCYGLPPSSSFPPIRRGEFVMIRGPSGGGKTTLLNMIGTIDCPTDGTIQIMGNNVDKDSDDDFLSDLRLRHIGFVFQTFNLIPTMTALENVELPMTLLGTASEKERKSRAKQLLGLVGLRNRVHHLPSELSGGEQQRVTIARALANNPSVLLLDEPTGDLDTSTTIDVMDLLLNINTLAGTTMVMVTHNPDVECYADRILYVSDGQFAQQAVNASPCPLVLAEYELYLKKAEQQTTVTAAAAVAAAAAATAARAGPPTAPQPLARASSAHPLAVPPTSPGLPVGAAQPTFDPHRATEDDRHHDEQTSLL